MGSCASSPKIYKNIEWSHKWSTSINTGRDLKEAIILFSGINPPGNPSWGDSFWEQSTCMKFVCVTCSEVISQQAEDPFCEDAGSEKVVPVVIHRKPGLHLRGTRHTLWIQRSVSQIKYVGGFKISLQNSKHHPQHLWTGYSLKTRRWWDFLYHDCSAHGVVNFYRVRSNSTPNPKTLLEFTRGWQMQAHRLKKADMRHKRFQFVEINH